MAFFKKFNRLTKDEFVMLQGTELMANMISNKWYACDQVIDHMENHATGKWCAIPFHDGYIIYFENQFDIQMVNAMLEPVNTPAPDIHSINISHEQYK